MCVVVGVGVVCGRVDARVCGYVGVAGVWMNGRVWVCGRPSEWRSGVWVCVCGTWASGCVGAWVRGCVWMWDLFVFSKFEV